MKDFFSWFPVIKFKTTDGAEIKWFPSEYFYQNSTEIYCLAIDPYGGGSQMVIGGSMMRQNMYIFDLEKSRIGVVRARCSDDPFMNIYDDPKYLDSNSSVKVPDPVDNKTDPEPIKVTPEPVINNTEPIKTDPEPSKTTPEPVKNDTIQDNNQNSSVNNTSPTNSGQIPTKNDTANDSSSTDHIADREEVSTCIN